MKIKLYLINGPLGAGKTTVLRQLLTRPEFSQARVIENEFASHSVDSEQLHDHQAEVATIAGICICCSTGDELVDVLTRLAAAGPEPVIIEATGVANSLQLLEKLAIGTVFDTYEIRHGLFVLDSVEAAMHPEIVARYLPELLAADTVLLSKTDLISQEKQNNLAHALAAAGVQHVEQCHEGKFDYRLLERKSMMVDFFVAFDGAIIRHDGATNFTIIDLTWYPLSPIAVKKVWPVVQKTYGLRRLKGDICDGAGRTWHIEATPAQLRYEPTRIRASYELVAIGESARNMTREQFIGHIEAYDGK